jgi:hypothetical protein
MVEQQVYGDKHLSSGRIVKVSYLGRGIFGVPRSGKKDTVKVLGEDKAIAISSCDFIKLQAVFPGESRFCYVKEFA